MRPLLGTGSPLGGPQKRRSDRLRVARALSIGVPVVGALIGTLRVHAGGMGGAPDLAPVGWRSLGRTGSAGGATVG